MHVVKYSIIRQFAVVSQVKRVIHSEAVNHFQFCQSQARMKIHVWQIHAKSHALLVDRIVNVEPLVKRHHVNASADTLVNHQIVDQSV